MASMFHLVTNQRWLVLSEAAVNHRKQSAHKNKPAQQPPPSGASVPSAVRLIKRSLRVCVHASSGRQGDLRLSTRSRPKHGLRVRSVISLNTDRSSVAPPTCSQNQIIKNNLTTKIIIIKKARSSCCHSKELACSTGSDLPPSSAAALVRWCKPLGKGATDVASHRNEEA